MSEEIKKHLLKGRYYVDHNTCLDHECCVYEALNFFKMDRETGGAYVFKQPETSEEEAQCKEAMNCCPVAAIHDNGDL